MKQSRWCSILLFIVLFSSCSKELPELKGIDQTDWISDKNGCLNKRREMVQSVHREKEKLLSLTEMEVVSLLGKPDENELYIRNQKFYYYHLTPSTACRGSTDTISLRLIVRFNAIGLAKEVRIE